VGHRRLAAAKIAGLDTVPCVIADMTENQQLITMLMENMQRSDLTTWEQAHGFQTMLDLGETVQSLADKTGLSETTVRRRVKLMELDQKQFEKAEARGATLKDYMELEKLEDPALKNKVLASIGTRNFEYELRTAVEEEKQERNKTAWEALLSTFAKPAAYSYEKHKLFKLIYRTELLEEFVVPEDKDTIEYFYEIDRYAYVRIFTMKNDSESDAQRQISPEEAEQQALKKRREEASSIAMQTRDSFIKNFSQAQAKKNIKHIVSFLLFNLMASGDWVDCDGEEFMSALELEIQDEFDFNDDLLMPALEKGLEKSLLAAAWVTLEAKKGDSYFNWNGGYAPNERLDRAYDFLIGLGYQMSDEEQQMRDGTHPLFKKEGGKDAADSAEPDGEDENDDE
jgi:ParB family chromosome partitioning protein